MLANRPDVGLGFKIEQEAWRDAFVVVNVFVSDQLLVANALLYLIVVGIHPVNFRLLIYLHQAHFVLKDTGDASCSVFDFCGLVAFKVLVNGFLE